MEPQFGLASRDDLWRLQNEMKNVYATQAEHADRLMRLERRQDDDTRLKSVWGGQSPFTSILNGTPQQGIYEHWLQEQNQMLTFQIIDPGFNPAAEAFKNFDQDPPNSLLGSLHLDTEDEPRRGASRANSVRFDESALHGHFGHTSRSSTDFLPLRTGSGLGSHPMTERSSSHKSDGRQSSTGQSTHSARASSFGFESRPLSATVAPFVPLGPPPGLFILGSAPSIIRCWLDTKFSNESLLYAAVCTGSYQSALDNALILRLGLETQITINNRGERMVKIPVYLPEATIQQSSSRASSPVPRLPTLTVEFAIQQIPSKVDTIQVFLGCDILRAQSADILFSLDRMTLFDDERNKVAVPLVRPENAAVFQSLRTTNVDLESSKDHPAKNSPKPTQSNGLLDKAGDSLDQDSGAEKKLQDQFSESTKVPPSSVAMSTPPSSSPSVIGEGRKSVGERENGEKSASARAGADDVTNGSPSDAPSKSEGANIWGSWRRDTVQNGRADLSSAGTTTTSGYQRAGRGRGMKVLKPARLNTSRSSAVHSPAGFDSAPPRSGDVAKASGPTPTTENQSSSSPGMERRSSTEGKTPLQPLTNKPRSSNPIGGASAFGWLNSGEQKQSPTASDLG